MLLKKLKITTVLFIIVATALAGMLFFAEQIVSGEIENKKNYTRTSYYAKTAVNISTLLHERQKERGLTGVFLGSQGTKMKDEMGRQRTVADEAYTKAKANLSTIASISSDEAVAQGAEELIKQLEAVTSVRASVDGLSMTRADAIGYYTKSNAKMIDVVNSLAKEAADPDSALAIVSFSNFMRGKEYSGIERAVGTMAFGVGAFAAADLDKLKRVISMQDAYNAMFLAFASSEQKAQYEAVMQSNEAKEIQHLREISMLNNADDLLKITAEHWYQTTTAKINMQREIEAEIAGAVADMADKKLVRAEAASKQAVGIAITAGLLIIGFSFLMMRVLSSSVHGVVKATTELGKGNLNCELPPAYNNELGQITRGLMVFKENALEIEKMRKDQEAAQAKAAEERKQIQERLASDFEQSVKGIVNMVTAAATELSQTAESMLTMAKDTTQKVLGANHEASATTVNVQSIAAASEQLSATVQEISTQVQKTASLVRQSQDKAQNADNAAGALNEATSKVAGAMDMIASIAGQINLLALNATIESARAGEAGKGFAVVASEVKNLANQTNKTTEEIRQIVEEMRSASEDIIGALRDIGGSVESILEATSGVASAVEEQSITTSEISKNIQSAASSTQVVAEDLKVVESSSAQAGSASEQVLAASKELSRQAEQLNTQVDNFLLRVRA